jgi:L-ascorbate metabolism protein UlaG (beta-lactamase superfamily)
MNGLSLTKARRSWWRRGLRLLLWLTALLLLAVGVLLALAWPSFGDTPSGHDLALAEASPHWRDGFQNPQPTWTDFSGAYGRLLSGGGNPDAEPARPVPVHKGTLPSAAPVSGLRITWFGHASALVEIDGARILTDPWWSERASPLGWAGPQRWFAPPIPLDALPLIDAVVISHDHYDHLDRDTILAMKAWKTKFVVPLGVGAHLRKWGIARSRIVELDWWQEADIAGLRIVATPARHKSGRTAWTGGEAFWAGYALIGDRHRIWYSGDSGYHAGLAQIGRRLGPFDATLIDSGQYDALWPDVHFGPELAVEAHRAVRGKAMIPIHWATVKLAEHGWTEPVERVLAAARCHDIRVLAAQPGKGVEPTVDTAIARWWPDIAWRNARQNPIVATRAGDPAKRISTPACGA